MIMYAIIKPIKLPVSMNFKFFPIKLASRNVSNCITPIAKIIPGTAYPTVKKELRNFNKLLFLYLTEKFIKTARHVHKSAEIIAR